MRTVGSGLIALAVVACGEALAPAAGTWNVQVDSLGNVAGGYSCVSDSVPTMRLTLVDGPLVDGTFQSWGFRCDTPSGAFTPGIGGGQITNSARDGDAVAFRAGSVAFVGTVSPGAMRGEAVLTLHREGVFWDLRGPFMASEGDNPIYVSRRERLRNRFLRCIGEIGRQLEASDAWEDAVVLYQRGIESDQLAEGLYRRLMVCYRELGRHAEAVEVFDACKRTIRAELEVDPSPETTAIYENLLRKL